MADAEIRAYRGSDEPAVVDLWRTVFPDDPPHNEARAVIAHKLDAQPEGFWVALDAEQLVGSVLSGYDGHRGWLYHLAVHPEARRRGIARALVARAEANLRERGCVKVNLQVRDGNESATSFYRALGYAVEARVSLGKRLG